MSDGDRFSYVSELGLLMFGCVLEGGLWLGEHSKHCDSRWGRTGVDSLHVDEAAKSLP